MINTIKTILANLIKNKTDKTRIQFLRYIFVGGIAFMVQFGSLYLFTDKLGIYYLISTAIGFILGLIANYALSIKWVFNKRTLDNVHSEFTIFAIIGVVGFVLNLFLVWFFTEYIFQNLHLYLISQIIAAALVLFWNFSARKFTLFK